MRFSRKSIEYLIKVAIFLLLCFAIYQQAFAGNDWVNLKLSFGSGFHWTAWPLLALAIALMPLNWGIEAMKWQVLMRPVERLGLAKAFNAILAGVTTGFITPNRVGEFGGRLAFVKAANRMYTFLVSLLEGFTQIVVTVLAGGLALLYHTHPEVSEQYRLGYVAVLGLVVVVLGIACYYPQLWLAIAERIPFLRKRKLDRQSLSKVPASAVTASFGFSFLRFLVYAGQYVLLLKFFGVEVSGIVLLQAVAVIFTLQTVAPSIAMIDLGIRGNLALFILLPHSENTLAILSAAYTLWVINLVIPAIWGFVLLSRQNLWGSTKTLVTARPGS